MNKQIKKGYYPEFTISSLIVGYVIGILLTVSMTYVSLVLSFGIGGSTIAALLGFAFLRTFSKRTSIIENNINQTVASAVNGASSGMMFTIPALFIMGYSDFDPYLMVFGCIAGSILGIAYIIPLRKQMIDFQRLPFPTGIAVAAILKVPGSSFKKIKIMLLGIFVSALAYFLCLFLDFETFNLGAVLHLPEYFNIVFFVSLMTVGAAYITGKGGMPFVLGGYLCYWVLAPVMKLQGILPEQNVLSLLRSDYFKPLGIGMLIGGAIMGIVIVFPMMLGAIRSMHKASKYKKSFSAEELPIKFLYFAIAGASFLLFIIALKSVQNMGVLTALLMAIIGTLWIWVSGVILSECTGRTDWTPLSGMTLIAVTLLVIISASNGAESAIISSIMVGAAACVAMSQSTDLMQDLKTGFLVGSSPKKQQLAQFSSVWLGPIIVIILTYVLHKAYVLGSPRLPAPQGHVLAGMLSGILGGDVPVLKYIAGTGIGALLSVFSSGLGVLVGLGFYLPFSVVLTYTIGLLIRIWTDKKYGENFSDNYGIPLAAGFLIGEAVVGVFYASYIVIIAFF